MQPLFSRFVFGLGRYCDIIDIMDMSDIFELASESFYTSSCTYYNGICVLSVFKVIPTPSSYLDLSACFKIKTTHTFYVLPNI